MNVVNGPEYKIRVPEVVDGLPKRSFLMSWWKGFWMQPFQMWSAPCNVSQKLLILWQFDWNSCTLGPGKPGKHGKMFGNNCPPLPPKKKEQHVRPQENRKMFVKKRIQSFKSPERGDHDMQDVRPRYPPLPSKLRIFKVLFHEMDGGGLRLEVGGGWAIHPLVFWGRKVVAPYPRPWCYFLWFAKKKRQLKGALRCPILLPPSHPDSMLPVRGMDIWIRKWEGPTPTPPPILLSSQPEGTPINTRVLTRTTLGMVWVGVGGLSRPYSNITEILVTSLVKVHGPSLKFRGVGDGDVTDLIKASQTMLPWLCCPTPLTRDPFPHHAWSSTRLAYILSPNTPGDKERAWAPTWAGMGRALTLSTSGGAGEGVKTLQTRIQIY